LLFSPRSVSDVSTSIYILQSPDSLEWERRDYNETVEAVLEGYEDVKAGRTQPADEFLKELRAKHGLPRLTNCTGRLRSSGALKKGFTRVETPTG
jgi:hypothetical protein